MYKLFIASELISTSVYYNVTTIVYCVRCHCWTRPIIVTSLDAILQERSESAKTDLSHAVPILSLESALGPVG